MDAAEFASILQRGETRQVEMKGATGFEGDMCYHLTASIAAMANIPGGGTIVVGVDTKTVPKVLGLSREQIGSFDRTTMANFLTQRLDPLPRFHVEHFSHPEGEVLLIQVTEFEQVPIVVKKQIEDTKHKLYAREGDILIRSHSCECRRVKSAEELRELLGRGLTKQTEQLLAQIRSIMLGSLPTVPEKPPVVLHQELLPQWASHAAALAQRREGLAWWEFHLLPFPHSSALDAKICAELIDKATIRWRGWSFPAFLNTNTQLKYYQDYLGYAYQREGRDDEGWQFSYRGAFAWAAVLSSELRAQDSMFNFPSPPQRVLSFQDICYSVTEQFRFAANLVEALACESIWLRMQLHGIKQRTLGSFDHGFFSWSSDVSYQDSLDLGVLLTRSELMSAWKEHALEWVSKIFTVFQRPDFDKKVIADLQQKLMERRW